MGKFKSQDDLLDEIYDLVDQLNLSSLESLLTVVNVKARIEAEEAMKSLGVKGNINLN